MVSKKDQKEYEALKKERKKIEERLAEMENRPKIYGYIRVSTAGQARDGFSLEAQEKELRNAGAEEIFSDTYTGKTTNRPELLRLKGKLKSGDTLVVTKLDRIARSAREGLELIDELTERGVVVRILNMGTLDDTPNGRLMLTFFLAFAEFERDLIVQRTQEGKMIARTKKGFRDGRPKKFDEVQRKFALELLNGGMSYKEVQERLNISTTTLWRIRKEHLAEELMKEEQEDGKNGNKKRGKHE